MLWALVWGRGTDGRTSPVIKYVYEIDYPPRGKDKYLKWVRSIADALQAPAELRRLASYDNVYPTTPHRVVEFTFDSPQDAATYFDREEIGLIVQSELPTHSANIRIKVLALRDDYIKGAVAETAAAHQDRPLVLVTRLAAWLPRLSAERTLPAAVLDVSRWTLPVRRGIDALAERRGIGSGLAMWPGADGPVRCESSCMRKYVIMGIQGSGKGTHAKMLAGDFDLEHIAVGDIFRWNVQHHTKLGAQVRRTMAAGLLVGDDLVEGVVGVRLREHDWNYGFIIDGFPRNERQAEFFLESYDLDGVIHLDLPDREVARRVLARRLCAGCGMDYNLIDNSPSTDGRCDACGGELLRREDDTEEALAVRLREYHAKTNPVLDLFRRKEYVVTVDSRPGKEQVQQAIRDRLGLPPSRLAAISSRAGAP
jgi:adenylate kinase